MSDPGCARVALLVGTRPEAIKLAPVARALAARPGFELLIITTGQHAELVNQHLAMLGLAADIKLNTMAHGQSLSELTARLCSSLGGALNELAPDAVVVQGDTTSAFVGALCGFYAGVPVGHVEAGLRSGLARSPFPEEANRSLIARLATWHFAPTKRAVANLLAEGIEGAAICLSGNTVIDNLYWLLATGVVSPGGFVTDRQRKVLVTMHRRENQGEVMAGLARAIKELAGHGDVEVLLPLHPSERVRSVVMPILADQPGITLAEPLGYREFVAALAASDLVLTDSGGVQEEAPALGKPVLVLRESTERMEGIEAGTAKLVGTDPDTVLGQARRVLFDPTAYAAMAHAENPYGDGLAADRIVDVLAEHLGGVAR